MNKIFISAIAVVALTTTVSADLGIEPYKVNRSSFTIGTSLSSFNSTSHETVYIPPGYVSAGRKISELTWEALSVTLLGVNASYNFDSNLAFYAGYKKNITTGDGVMDDLDWVNDAIPDLVTHWSHHENTVVDNVSILDLGIKYRYELSNVNIETVSNIYTWVSLGYKKENLEFNAYDGYGVYSGDPVSFSGLAITYKQENKGPYVGVGADFKNESYILNLGFKYSPFINSQYTDRHHMRNPAFTETTYFDETDMIHINIGLKYIIDKTQMLSLSYEATEYNYVRGTRIRRFDDGTVYVWANSAAIDSINTMTNISYNYAF